MSMNEVIKICEEFVAAIMSIPSSSRHASLQSFPHGCCGATAELIGTLLNDRGFGAFEYIHGEKRGISSHAWAQQGNLIVDLTACQFPSIKEVIIVSSNSPWHDEFKIIGRHPIDLVASDKGALMPLSSFYEELCDRMRPALTDAVTPACKAGAPRC